MCRESSFEASLYLVREPGSNDSRLWPSPAHQRPFRTSGNPRPTGSLLVSEILPTIVPGRALLGTLLSDRSSSVSDESIDRAIGCACTAEILASTTQLRYFPLSPTFCGHHLAHPTPILLPVQAQQTPRNDKNSRSCGSPRLKLEVIMCNECRGRLVKWSVRVSDTSMWSSG